VSVIVPFAGPRGRIEQLIGELEALARLPSDELIVADNGEALAAARGSVRILGARGVRSPGFARNRGAREARGEWLVFFDADTEPRPDLLDAYFDPAPHPQTAVLAGAIVDVAARPSLAARHSAARNQMSQRATLQRRGTPYAQTANCAVRRSAFEEVGGFAEEIRAGEDADLCFRLQRAGWRLEERPAAEVAHRSRETASALFRQLARHGSGAHWLERRYPGEFPAPRPRELAGRAVRCVRAVARALARRDPEAAGFALLDLAGSTAFDLGRLLPNEARRD
jgi:GT2 family glycosyltransferase